MREQRHPVAHYSARLRNLQDKLLLMSHKSEQMIADSVEALVDRKPSLAEDVILRRSHVDRLEGEVDALCQEVLALEHPVACDLRFITTTHKIVRDVARVARIGVNIAGRALELIQEPELKPLIDLPIMAGAARRVLKESLDSFVNSDVPLAEHVIRSDRVIDSLYQQIFRELLTYMMENKDYIPRALRLVFVAKHLERVGDHSCNIAEMVIVMHSANQPRGLSAASASGQ